MKHKTIKRCLVAMITLVITTAAGWASATEYGYTPEEGKSVGVEQYCQVTSHFDDVLRESVRAAEHLFNSPGNQQGCKGHIDFLTSTGEEGSQPMQPIKLRGEIEIGPYGGGSSLGQFVFGPRAEPQGESIQQVSGGFAKFQIDNQTYSTFYHGIGDSGEVNFEFSNLSEYSDLDKVNCVIRIQASNSVIQNIVIEGNSGSWSGGEVIHGICVQANNVTLKNVIVSDMPGAGIVVSEDATGIRFEGEYGKAINNDYGIIFRGVRNDADVPVPTGSGDQENSFAAVSNFKQDSIDVEGGAAVGVVTGRNILVVKPGYIVYDYLDMYETSEGSDVYDIVGQVISCDPTFGSTCSLSNATPVEIETVRVYAEPMGGIALYGKNTDAVRFVKQATEDELQGKIDGWFQIELDRTAMDLKQSRVFLVPVTKDGMVASSSESFPLETHTTGGGTVGGNGSMGGDLSGEEGFVEVEGHGFIYAGSESECNMGTGPFRPMTNFYTDSDGDGIWDYIEMSILPDGTVGPRVCSCSGRLSCWHKADGEKDGILDSEELWCMRVASDDNGVMQPVVDGDGKIEKVKLTRDNWADGCAGLNNKEVQYVPLDTDGDGKPDINDQDNDNDGLKDYVENRKRYYNPQRKAYYYPIGSSDKYEPIGQSVVCYDPDRPNDQNDPKYDPNIGVSWGAYVVNHATGDVRGWSRGLANAEIEGDRSLVFLECRNSMLFPEWDMNYSDDNEEDNDRSNFLVADSDGDGFDDKADNCPWTYNTDNDCVPKCQQDAILYGIKDSAGTYLEYHFDRPIGLAMNEEGVPVLFAEIKTVADADRLLDICTDRDNDQIPDCIEVYVSRGYDIGICPDQSVGTNEYFLDPLKIDTDGDEVPDRLDMCPFDADDKVTIDGEETMLESLDVIRDSQGDIIFEPSESDLACNPHDIYIGHELLAFYMDRDGDGLRDIEEYNFGDVAADYTEYTQNVNDRPQYSPSSVASPTDPLRKDSDEDYLSDKLEREILFTKPYNSDSDDDGLSDFEEVNGDGDPQNDIHPVVNDAVCNDIKYDSDPMSNDTDKDELTDFQEKIIVGSSPNDIDSDNDGLCDGTVAVSSEESGENCIGFELKAKPTEMDWTISYLESDPCNDNTDGDEWLDGEEIFGCRNDPAPECTGSDPGQSGTGEGNPDEDHDGLPDIFEAKYGATAGEYDTDHDGLPDGCIGTLGELCNAKRDGWIHDASVYFTACEPPDFMNCDTDPNNADSDGDGLNDMKERTYPSDPWKADTDNDCIPDGIEDANQNGKYDSGESKAASPETEVNGVLDMWEAIDTDGDGLPDGKHQAYVGWEDSNCDGIVDPGDTSQFLWDTDFDGMGDFEERTLGGFFDPNRQEATVPRGRGCSLIPGTSVDTSMMLIFAGLMVAIVGVRRKMKRVKVKA